MKKLKSEKTKNKGYDPRQHQEQRSKFHQPIVIGKNVTGVFHFFLLRKIKYTASMIKARISAASAKQRIFPGIHA